MAVAKKSLHPSPMPPDSRAAKQREFSGPPVSRLETSKKPHVSEMMTLNIIVNKLVELTSMSVLVDDNASLEAAVTLWSRSVPGVHSHTSWLTIRRRSKVGVVYARPVLGVKDSKVSSNTTLVPVVNLEVSCFLVEAKDVKHVMVNISGIE